MTSSSTRMKCRTITNELRDHISDFEDFFRPLRSYFYWEKHCYDIPICYVAEKHIRFARRC